MSIEREDCEKNFRFMSLVIMENKLKKITQTIIEGLQFADIKTIMVTGKHSIQLFIFPSPSPNLSFIIFPR